MSVVALILIYGAIASIIVSIIACIQLKSAIGRVNKARARLHEIINELPYKKKRS